MTDENGPSVSGPGAGKDAGRRGTRSIPDGQARTGRAGRRRRPAGGGRPGHLGGRSRATLFTWGTTGLVVVVVAILVIAKATASDTSTQTARSVTPAPASVAQEVGSVPAAVYDKVGISSPTPINPPTVVGPTSPLTVGGKPGVFYLGGEFCPYCAAERWAIITSLARFGTFSGLGEMESSPTAVAPNTQTFTFHGATFRSELVGLRAVERYSDVPDSATGYYTQLERLSREDRKLIATYFSARYLPGVTNGQVGFPFVDVGNRVFVHLGSQFSPTILANLTRQQIAAGLSDATNPVTQAIIASANELSAAICATDGQQPVAVCTSRGVTAAAKAMKLTA